MTQRTSEAVTDRPSRERTAWRTLVLAQIAVLAVIVLTVLAILAIGQLGSLFSQRSL